MQLMRLLLVLQITTAHTKKLTSGQRNLQGVPQIKTGDVPRRGQAYQIVRIVEYLVPYPYKERSKKWLRMRSLPNTPSAPNENSLEIIPASIEKLFTLEPTTVTTKQTKLQTHFQLKVLLHNASICSGALISTRLVLTSALCFASKQTRVATLYRVQASASRIFAVQQILLNPSQVVKELALLVLMTAVQDAQLQPVMLCNKMPLKNSNVTMFMTKTRLHFLRTALISNGACKGSYAQEETAYITEEMLCAHNTNKLSDCLTTKGDSLLLGQRLCGINIYGPRCVEGAINGDLYANVFKARVYLDKMKKLYG